MKKAILIISILCLFFNNIFAEYFGEEGLFKVTRTEIPLSQLPVDNFKYDTAVWVDLDDHIKETQKMLKSEREFSKAFGTVSAMLVIIDYISFGIASRKHRYFELEFTCDVVYKNKTFKLEKGIALCAQGLGQAKDNLKDIYIPYIFISENKLGSAKNVMKDLKVKDIKYTAIRKSQYQESEKRDNFYVYNIPANNSFVEYEYNAKITYELEKPKRNTEIITEASDISYTSEMQTLGVSFFDFMNNTVDQARKLGHKKTPVINIENIKVYKTTYTPRN